MMSKRPLSKTTTRTALALALSIATLAPSALVPGEALAQDPPKDPPKDSAPSTSQGAVPGGSSGAAVTQQPGQPAPAPAGQATLPRPTTYVDPGYTDEARDAGIQGVVTLQVDVGVDGKVKSAVVVGPLDGGLDALALAAVKKTEFSPARRADGTLFAARILYRYTFSLKTVEKEPDGTDKPGAAAAEAEGLRGVVLASGGDATLAGARVKVKPLEGGAEQVFTTTESGGFAFDSLAPGKYAVTVEIGGFDSLTVEEEIVAGERTEVKYRLSTKADGGVIDVQVRGAKPPREVTKRTVTAREISRIPGTNGDALRSIQNLPGVARPPAILGLLIVRGSAPQDTQTFIDGTPVPLIYHFGGLSSVVPTEVLDKIDFYPGNFSSQYGRVMGGIVDVGIRSPRDDGEWHGLVQADLIDARFLVEKSFQIGKYPLKLMAAGRRSYIDAWLGPVLSSAGGGVTQAPVYYDYQLLAETNPTPNSSLRASFFGSDDALEFLLADPSPGSPASPAASASTPPSSAPRSSTRTSIPRTTACPRSSPTATISWSSASAPSSSTSTSTPSPAASNTLTGSRTCSGSTPASTSTARSPRSPSACRSARRPASRRTSPSPPSSSAPSPRTRRCSIRPRTSSWRSHPTSASS